MQRDPGPASRICKDDNSSIYMNVILDGTLLNVLSRKIELLQHECHLSPATFHTSWIGKVLL